MVIAVAAGIFIMQHWKESKLATRRIPDFHCWVLSDVEQTRHSLEDDRLLLQAMMLQTHGDGVRQDVVECEEKLRDLSELLEEWQACQIMWISLSSVLLRSAPMQACCPWSCCCVCSWPCAEAC